MKLLTSATHKLVNNFNMNMENCVDFVETKILDRISRSMLYH